LVERPGAATRPNAAGAESPTTQMRRGAGRSDTFEDPWSRQTKFVSEADLMKPADVVLVFPKEIDFQTGYKIALHKTTTVLHARMLYWREPRSLLQLMKTATEEGALERDANRIVEVPVR